MNPLFKIIITIGVFFKIFDVLTSKYKNEYPINYFIGLRGKGKTTLATMFSIQNMRLNRHIYANFEVFGAEKLDMSTLGKYDFEPESVLMLDEISLCYSNRDFKSFPKEVERLFRLSRHKKLHIYCFSQALDTDRKIILMIDNLFIVDKYLRVFTIAKKVNRYLVLHRSEEQDGEKKTENFITEDFKYAFPTEWIFCFIPRWVKFFNSFECEKLPRYKTERYIFNDEVNLYRITHFKHYILDLKNDCVKKLKKLYHEHYMSFDVKYKYFRTLQDI